MLPQETLAYIKSIEILARKLIAGPLSGDYRYKLRGHGFEFEQLRDYQQGDDVRFIDWRASARTQKILVRSYLADRNRTILIAIDISASMGYGSTTELKYEAANKLALLIAFASLAAKDAVGLVLFSDHHIDLYLPPKTGRQHIFNIAKEIMERTNGARPSGEANQVFKFIASLKTKNLMVCLISDFNFDFDASHLNAITSKHEIIAFKCQDPLESNFPKIGLLTFQDSETGKKYTFDTSDKITEYLQSWQTKQNSILRTANIDTFTITPGQDFIKNLVVFLRQRVNAL